MDNGVATSSSLTMIPSAKQLIPPSGTDLYQNMAEQWLRMVFGMGCHVEIKTWIEKVKRARPDALLMGFFDYDRWLGQMHKMGAREVEKATGRPHLLHRGRLLRRPRLQPGGAPHPHREHQPGDQDEEGGQSRRGATAAAAQGAA